MLGVLARLRRSKTMRDEFVRLLVEKTKKIKIGNPLDRDVYLGPVINEDAVKTYERAVDAGAAGRRHGSSTGGRRLTDGEFAPRLLRRADDHRRPAGRAIRSSPRSCSSRSPSSATSSRSTKRSSWRTAPSTA